MPTLAAPAADRTAVVLDVMTAKPQAFTLEEVIGLFKANPQVPAFRAFIKQWYPGLRLELATIEREEDRQQRMAAATARKEARHEL